jgi:hypothetical protein
VFGNDGYLYVAGLSDSPWLGPAGEEPVSAHSGSKDLLVLKLDVNGTYQWHTFHGSDRQTWGAGLAMDQAGDLLVTGSSSASFDGPGGEPPLNAHGGGIGCELANGVCADFYVLKLGPDGAYRWHTFYGASGDDDFNHAAAVGNTDDVYATGFSHSPWNGPAGQSPGSAHSGDDDLFVLKLAPDGSYQWHTFYGAEQHDGGYSIAVDASENVTVTGKSYSSWNGPSGQPPLNGIQVQGDHESDLYVLKLDGSGEYLWHTFYGSSDNDLSSSHVVDSAGNILAAGASDSTWNGPSGESPLNPFGTSPFSLGIVVFKLDADGAYRWHTFYGPSYVWGIRGDGQGNYFLGGWSDFNWIGPCGQFPLEAASYDIADPADDILVIKLRD